VRGHYTTNTRFDFMLYSVREIRGELPQGFKKRVCSRIQMMMLMVSNSNGVDSVGEEPATSGETKLYE